MKTISIVTGCFNEEDNVEELYRRVRQQLTRGWDATATSTFSIDNASTDRTVAVLKRLAAADHNVKIIVNSRNFGHIRSPMHAFTQARGDAVIGIVADLQDPPEMITDLVAGWEEGFCDGAVPSRAFQRREPDHLPTTPTVYYRLVNKLSSLQTFENFTGFGLYDRKVIDQVIAFRRSLSLFPRHDRRNRPAP